MRIDWKGKKNIFIYVFLSFYSLSFYSEISLNTNSKNAENLEDKETITLWIIRSKFDVITEWGGQAHKDRQWRQTEALQ